MTLMMILDLILSIVLFPSVLGSEGAMKRLCEAQHKSEYVKIVQQDFSATSLKKIVKKWTIPIKDWKLALNPVSIVCDGKVSVMKFRLICC